MFRNALSIACCAFTASATVAAAGDPPIVPLGAGSYFDGLPDGTRSPSNAIGQPIAPRVSPGFSAPPPTNEFWSSWIYPRALGSTHGSTMHPHPLTVRAIAAGLAITHAPQASLESRGYSHDLAFAETLLAGLEGLNAPQVRTESCGDWHVRGEWPAGDRTMLATIGHGLPIVTLEADATDTARVEFFGPFEVFADQGSAIGVRMGGIAYGLFAPEAWTVSGGIASAPLTGLGCYAVAALPDDSPDTLSLFAKHAFTLVTDTRVSWVYEPATSEVVVTHTIESESLDGSGALPLTGLYRHQWMHSDQATFASYAGPRGEMKLAATDAFVCRFPFRGVLPSLPEVGAFAPGQLEALVNEAESLGFDLGADTYWSGKGMQKAAVLAPIAEQAGDPVARERFLDVVRGNLEDWLDARTGDRFFAYDPIWRTMLGTPDSFNLAQEMNDHHFHYGYHVLSAALVAMYDRAWAESYAGMIELLIRDVANWDRADTRFPFLRTFDPYAGHSWASGHANFDSGNNQESSSESMNFATGLILWGSVMGRDDIRDLGIYLHAVEAAAIEQYWFDADDVVFPANLARPLAGIVWSNGTRYTTWWTDSVEEIHGINFLPVTGGSLYLGRRPGMMLDNWNLLLTQNFGPPDRWSGILWSALATDDPTLALSLMEANPGASLESGDTRARTEHWIRTLAATGPVEAAVTADAPTAAVFSDGVVRTYAGWNPGEEPQDIRFSDGFAIRLAPGALASARRGVCGADIAPPFGELGDADLLAFIDAFLGSMPVADLDGNGVYELADIAAYIRGFNAGCEP